MRVSKIFWILEVTHQQYIIIFSLQKVSALVTSDIRISVRVAIFFLLMEVLELVFQCRWENYAYSQFYNLILDLNKVTDHHRFCFGLSKTYFSQLFEIRYLKRQIQFTFRYEKNIKNIFLIVSLRFSNLFHSNFTFRCPNRIFLECFALNFLKQVSSLSNSFVKSLLLLFCLEINSNHYCCCFVQK